MNEVIRQSQVNELLNFIENSSEGADLTILGGDFNNGCSSKMYQLITSAGFKDADDVLYEDQIRPATYGNPENSVDAGTFGSHTLDFIFIKSWKEDVRWSSEQTVKEFQ